MIELHLEIIVALYFEMIDIVILHIDLMTYAKQADIMMNILAIVEITIMMIDILVILGNAKDTLMIIRIES